MPVRLVPLIHPSGSDPHLIDHNKLRLTLANDALRVCEAIHVNRDPATIHEHEVGVTDQPEMSLAKFLDEKRFRMSPETEHFGVTRPELLLVHGRRMARARMLFSTGPVYIRAAFDFRLFMHACAGIRIDLRLVLLLHGVGLLPFRRRSCLRFVGLSLLLLRLRLLRFRCLTQCHERQPDYHCEY